LLIAGLQAPLIPLVEVAGSVKELPEQIPGTCVNEGVVLPFTVTVIVAVVAHCPAAGVKVYVVVAVLLTAGVHIPLMPLPEVTGSEIIPPEQIAGCCENAGTVAAVEAFMVIELLFTVTAGEQVAFPTITRETTLPFVRVEVVKTGLFVPALTPFTFH